MSKEFLAESIAVALGESPADLVLRGAKIVNTLSGEVHGGDVAIFAGRIAGIGSYDGESIVDLHGGYLVPGLIDSHCHIESGMLAPAGYAAAVLPFGTTTVFADPHEIANVMGIEGIELMIRLSEHLPLSIRFLVPSCVPATDMESSGASIGAEEVAALLGNKAIVGLAEMMNYPGVIYRVPAVLDKIEAALGRIIDGHAPGLSGKALNAYVSAGISSEHEATTVEEAAEKLRAGMYLMIREGTGARNLEALLPVINRANSRRILFASDDLHPPELLCRGHIDYMIRKAIDFGVEPIEAIRMGTLNAAEHFEQTDIGAIAPGRAANLVWVESLEEFHPRMVWAKGVLRAEDGLLIDNKWQSGRIEPPNTMNTAPFDESDFAIIAEDQKKAHIIGLIHGQIVTDNLLEPVKVEGGLAVADIERDILKLAVIERHRATGNIGLGFVKGFGLKRGALASSVAHDSHNLIVVGTNDADMSLAAKAVVEMRGGFAAVAEGRVLGTLALPLAGLMAIDNAANIDRRLGEMKSLAESMGCVIEDPFMLLGFLALPVIPKLKLTDRGLVDVERFAPIGLFD